MKDSAPSSAFADFDQLTSGHFDSLLTEEESLQLDGLLAADPALASRFARAALLHDRLHDLLRRDAGDLAAGPSGATTALPALRDRRWAIVGAAAALVAGVAILAWQGTTTASAATAVLDRILATAGESVDREYRIQFVDHGPAAPAATVPASGGGRKPGIDGASLFVRGGDRFVLVRRFGDGTPFVTGSDGELGWAAPPRGHVHLSRDARRFRRAVPGEREEIPFLDLRGGLEALRRGYDLEVSPGVVVAAADEQGSLRRLDATRRPGRRGPPAVHVWFDAAGVARRIEIEGLPLEDGDPRGVALELVSQRNLGEDFFRHESHHAPDRPVDWE